MSSSSSIIFQELRHISLMGQVSIPFPRSCPRLWQVADILVQRLAQVIESAGDCQVPGQPEVKYGENTLRKTLVVKLDFWNINSMDKYGWIWIGMVGWTMMELHKDPKIRDGAEMICQVLGLEAVRRNCPSTVPERFIWICYEHWIDVLHACGLKMHEAGRGCKIRKGMDVKWHKQIVYKQ